MNKKPILPVCHFVDTEGPLNETLADTFLSLKNKYGITDAPTQERLNEIQNAMNLPKHLTPSQVEEIKSRYSAHRLNYNRTWDDVNTMCEKLFAKEYRDAHADSLGNPYVINWACVDFLGFDENPRNRDLTPNAIFKFYHNWIQKSGTSQDRLYWHYHPIAFSRAAHRSGTNLNHYPLHYKSLCHRILDCSHFPAAFRPGYHMERVDLNLFLEQWIPFDFANQNIKGRQLSANYGRIQNWDGAPTDWSVYHPSFNDARRPGELKRSIARTLNVGTDFSVLTEDEASEAFESCLSGKPVILSFADHDFRDMRAEIHEAHSIIKKVHSKYQSRIDFKYCSGVEAMRMALKLPKKRPVQIDTALKLYSGTIRLEVRLDQPCFGAQPFLAIRNKEGELFHDNFCLTESNLNFFYVFDGDSIPAEQVKDIGIALNDATGNTSVTLLNDILLEPKQIKFNMERFFYVD